MQGGKQRGCRSLGCLIVLPAVAGQATWIDRDYVRGDLEEMVHAHHSVPAFGRFPRHHCFTDESVRTGCCSGDLANITCFDDVWTYSRCCHAPSPSERLKFKTCVQTVRDSMASCMNDGRTLGCSGSKSHRRCEALYPISATGKSAFSMFVQDTDFTRALWCLTKLSSVNSVMDLFIGSGFTGHILSHGFVESGKRWRLFGYDINAELVHTAALNLRPFGVHVVSNNSRLNPLANVTIIHGRVPSTRASSGQLRLLCRDGVDIVWLDPTFPMQPEFLQIERHCRPRAYMIFNTNLDGNAGWLRQHLLLHDEWAEVITGTVRDFNVGQSDWEKAIGVPCRSLRVIRSWSFLLRDHENGKHCLDM
eukprot:gnl/MRDRNA2_/MRDRNA2_56603_c0_seq1.p1 gnl/MRDRNA2_/MRDRNA2_56603_c0~~gnl/MRDRNA2_/MRDRNA2_56603_c0_seq1.p1  ORF type:complete len:363 (-),score=34.35 gnl/MRDRNA2_/MRDRNA2_56603_c0_seq1:31-1119(-)